jgi:hypothetical protein
MPKSSSLSSRHLEKWQTLEGGIDDVFSQFRVALAPEAGDFQNDPEK